VPIERVRIHKQLPNIPSATANSAYLHPFFVMSLRRLASKSSFLYQDHERGDKYCTSPMLERKLEVFAWVPGHKAPEGNVLTRLVNRFQDPTKPHQCYYKHEATIPDFISKIDLSQFTLTPPSQCDLELVQTVTDHLRCKHKEASDGW
jgi:hypothetical protein